MEPATNGRASAKPLFNEPGTFRKPAALATFAASFRRISRRASLRTRLLAMVLLAYIPAFALIVYNHFEEARLERNQATQAALLNARFTAAGYERLLEGTRHVLMAYAQLEESSPRRRPEAE